MGLRHLVHLAFVYGLCAVYSALALARMAIRILRVGPRRFFAIKPRPGPPAVLTDPEWHHARLQLSVPPDPSDVEEEGEGRGELQEVALHYVQAGSSEAPLMLFVHGFPEFWYTWRHQLRYFKDTYRYAPRRHAWARRGEKKGCRVVAVDMRGYADSDKPSGISAYAMEKLTMDLKELILALGRGRWRGRVEASWLALGRLREGRGGVARLGRGRGLAARPQLPGGRGPLHRRQLPPSHRLPQGPQRRQLGAIRQVLVRTVRRSCC